MNLADYLLKLEIKAYLLYQTEREEKEILMVVL